MISLFFKRTIHCSFVMSTGSFHSSSGMFPSLSLQAYKQSCSLRDILCHFCLLGKVLFQGILHLYVKHHRINVQPTFIPSMLASCHLVAHPVGWYASRTYGVARYSLAPRR